MTRRSPSLVLAVLDIVLIVAAAVAIIVAAGRLTLEDLVKSALVTRAVVGIRLLAVVAFVAVPLLVLALAALDFVAGLRRASLCAGGIAGALLLVPALWTLGGPALASRQERRVEREWARTVEPMEAFLARYPDAAMSDGALALEAAAARIGIEMNPNRAGAHPQESVAKDFQAIARMLYTYLGPQHGRDATEPALPSAELSAWLAKYRDEVLALVEVARGGRPIAFETSWASFDPPMPGLSGLQSSASVAVVLALESDRAGDAATARDAIEASWRIGGAARERGDLVGQFLAFGIDGRTLRALRRMEHPPPGWPDRLSDPDHRRGFLRSLQGEAWLDLSRARRIRSFDQGPVLRLMACDNAEALRVMVEELSHGDPCRMDVDAIESKVEGSLFRGNVLARSALPSHVRGWISAVEADLEVELTRMVLEARAGRNRDGSWPATPGEVESKVCPGSSWRSVADGRVLSITLDPGPQVGQPLAFQSR
jgi:hypothetical protein